MSMRLFFVVEETLFHKKKNPIPRAITECTQASIVLDEFGSFLVTAQAEAKDLIASHISQVLEAYLLENASAIEKINTDVLKGGEDSDWAMHKDVLSKGPVGAMEAAMELTLKVRREKNDSWCEVYLFYFFWEGGE